MIWLYFTIPLPFVVKYYNYTTFLTDAGLEVKVKDPPKGMIPPGTQLVKPKADPQPNKVREGKIKRGIVKILHFSLMPQSSPQVANISLDLF